MNAGPLTNVGPPQSGLGRGRGAPGSSVGSGSPNLGPALPGGGRGKAKASPPPRSGLSVGRGKPIPPDVGQAPSANPVSAPPPSAPLVGNGNVLGPVQGKPGGPPTPSRAPVGLQSSALLIDGLSTQGSLKPVVPSRRLFGPEIQMLMHAFGEIRYPARDSLEIVEDIVRRYVKEIAIAAAQKTVEVAESQGNAGMVMSKMGVVVSVDALAAIIAKNPRSLQRFYDALDQANEGENEKKDTQGGSPRKRMKPALDPYALPDAVAELIGDVASDRPRPGGAGANRPSFEDCASLCSFRALCSLKMTYTKPLFQDFGNCKATTLVRGISKAKNAPNGVPRITLFREWLDFSSKDQVVLTDEVIHGLGAIAWDAIGFITQSALLVKHDETVRRGLSDPRSFQWSNSRHLLAALTHGIATAVMLPLTDRQFSDLRSEIDSVDNPSTPGYHGTLHGTTKWKGRINHNEPSCLLPRHIKEAIRRIAGNMSGRAGGGVYPGFVDSILSQRYYGPYA